MAAAKWHGYLGLTNQEIVINVENERTNRCCEPEEKSR
jgi:hypothetical protein